MPTDDRPIEHKSSMSLDVIAWRMETMERSFDKFAEEMRMEIKELHASFALASRGCPMAGQCEAIVKDVKELQKAKENAKGVFITVGVICTFLGWLLSNIPSWIK